MTKLNVVQREESQLLSDIAALCEEVARLRLERLALIEEHARELAVLKDHRDRLQALVVRVAGHEPTQYEDGHYETCSWCHAMGSHGNDVKHKADCLWLACKDAAEESA